MRGLKKQDVKKHSVHYFDVSVPRDREEASLSKDTCPAIKSFCLFTARLVLQIVGADSSSVLVPIERGKVIQHIPFCHLTYSRKYHPSVVLPNLETPSQQSQPSILLLFKTTTPTKISAGRSPRKTEESLATGSGGGGGGGGSSSTCCTHRTNTAAARGRMCRSGVVTVTEAKV